MSEYSEIVCDLLQARRAEPSATAVFRAWKHDADLCPGFQKQIQRIFSAFKRYRVISYEIQGLKDQGTDVLLIEWVMDQKEFVCFQIKGEWDLAQEDYLKTFKAQFFDAKNKFGSKLKAYYVVVCYSLVTEDKKSGELVIDKTKVKAIIREFSPEALVRVVEPEFSIRFLSLSAVQIDAIIKSRFGDQDIVLKEALELTRDLGLMERVILLFMMWAHIFDDKPTMSADDVMHSSIIQELHQKLVFEMEEHFYDFDYQIAHDLETLQSSFIECDSNGKFSLPLQRVQPLVVLMVDGSVRYEHDGSDLLEYTLRMLKGEFD